MSINELVKLTEENKYIDELIRLLLHSNVKNYYPKSCALWNNLSRITSDPDFSSRLDTNPNLICFLNGVYDFKNKCFRVGLPEDYISKCIGTYYDSSTIPINNFF